MCVSPGRSSLLRCTVCVSYLAGLLSSGVLYVCLTWQVFSPQVYCMCVSPGRSSLLRCTVCVSYLAGLLSSGVLYVCLTWQVFSPQVYCMCVSPDRSSLLRCTVCVSYLAGLLSSGGGRVSHLAGLLSSGGGRVSHLAGLLSSGVLYVCLTWQVFSPQVYCMCVSPGRSSLLRCTVCVSYLAGLLSSGVPYVCLTWQAFSPQVVVVCLTWQVFSPQVVVVCLTWQVFSPQVVVVCLTWQVFSPQVVVVCLTWQVFSPQVYCMCVSPGRSSLLRCTVCVSHLAGLLSSGGGRVYPLAVRLAGVELTPEGRVWLEQHLSPAQTVWLKLVSREEETLQCLVSVSRGSLRSLCLNEEVLRLGLARTVPVSGLHPQSHLYLRLHQRLLKAEVKAERKGRGMWKEDSLWERTSQAVWDNSLVRLIRRIFKWM
ncbi:protein C3orf33 homolog isoform X12 [Oncorhynchus keta]|uniref:protein C3orf33 homolog isoform X10 n=1 Tax=Oncorhynchus keta TaxID=8018 RepID=UPI002279FEA1|nr:protein C3orf33 homolog isoform X10 [Oncorhynchus keta]XP_052354822.1 protein C3orf33 homolog isoform X12 [Oncorhynchus keta]